MFRVQTKCNGTFSKTTEITMQMSELFNHRSSLAGKIPSGLFNYAFAFDGSTWAQDASNTKFLAMDGYFITLFELRIEHQPLALVDHVIKAVPSTWDPCGIARYAKNYRQHDERQTRIVLQRQSFSFKVNVIRICLRFLLPSTMN